MHAYMSVAFAALALIIVPPASVAVIDFNAQPTGNNPNPLVLPGGTFTSVGGFNNIENVPGSNGLCSSASSSSSADCSRDLEVLFGAPSSGISFAFGGNNNTNIGDDIGDVQLFAGATFLGTANVIVQDGDVWSRDLVSLAGFSGVTRLQISSTDLGGVFYDDFTFTPSNSAVPEPSTYAMMGLGLAALGLLARRKKA